MLVLNSAIKCLYFRLNIDNMMVLDNNEDSNRCDKYNNCMEFLCYSM